MGPENVTHSIERERLIARLAFVRTPVIALVAPAGFGKSWLARAFAQRSQASFFLTCAELESEEQAASSLLSGLSRNPAHDLRVPRADAEGNLVEQAFAAWNSLASHTIAIIDDVGTATGRPGIQRFLARLLQARPESAVLVLCSRTPMASSTSVSLPEDVALTLGVNDLRFNSAEIAAVLPGSSPHRLGAIATLTEGWPAAVFAFERASSAKSLKNDVVAGDPGLQEFRQYVFTEVVMPLPAKLRHALAACCTIPAPSKLDVAAALDALSGEFDELDELMRQLPLVRYDANDKVVVHPLLQASMIERGGEGNDEHLMAAARNLSASGKHIAAARLFMTKGLVDDVVHELEQAGPYLFVEPSSEYWSIIAALEVARVQASPLLWNASLAVRRFVDDPRVLAKEATMLAASIPAGETKLMAAYWRATTLSDLGRFDEALAVFDEFGRDTTLSLSVHELDFVDLTRAAILSRLGHFNETVYLVHTISVRPRESNHLLANVPFLPLAEIRMNRYRGQWEIEYLLLKQFLSGARASKRFNMQGMALAEATFGAWLADDDDLFEAYAMMLHLFLQDHPMPGFQALNETFQGSVGTPKPQYELPRWTCVRLLARCAIATCPDPLWAAQEALLAADVSGEPFFQVLSRIAVAELLPEQRSRILADAAPFARQIESRPLQVLLAELADNPEATGGFIAAFTKRLRAHVRPERRVAEADATAPIVVELLHGQVSRAGRALPVSPGGLALLVALAIEGKPLSRESLCERLWSVDEEDSGSNALKMCVHRTRRQLGAAGAVIWNNDGYSLGAFVVTDVDQIQTNLRLAARKRGLSDDDRGAFLRIAQQLATSRSPRFVGHAWFEQAERRLVALADEIRLLLLSDVRISGDPALAITVTAALLSIDPCDEAALALAIRSYLQRDDRANAIKAFLTYEVALKADHDLEPSEDVKNMLRI